MGLSLRAGNAAAGLGHPRPGSVSPSGPVQRKGSQAWQPSPVAVWCFFPTITKQLCLLLSTAHHRRSFSTTQHANELGLY